VLPQWLLTWNINIASDDNYAMDFSKSITKSAEHVLPREINNMYFGSFWYLGVLVSNYQILQDPAVPSYRQYSRLPQLTFHAGNKMLWV